MTGHYSSLFLYMSFTQSARNKWINDKSFKSVIHSHISSRKQVNGFWLNLVLRVHTKNYEVNFTSDWQSIITHYMKLKLNFKRTSTDLFHTSRTWKCHTSNVKAYNWAYSCTMCIHFPSSQHRGWRSIFNLSLTFCCVSLQTKNINEP
jgi:hypothetical protein